MGNSSERKKSWDKRGWTLWLALVFHRLPIRHSVSACVHARLEPHALNAKQVTQHYFTVEYHPSVDKALFLRHASNEVTKSNCTPRCPAKSLLPSFRSLPAAHKSQCSPRHRHRNIKPRGEEDRSKDPNGEMSQEWKNIAG